MARPRGLTVDSLDLNSPDVTRARTSSMMGPDGQRLGGALLATSLRLRDGASTPASMAGSVHQGRRGSFNIMAGRRGSFMMAPARAQTPAVQPEMPETLWKALHEDLAAQDIKRVKATLTQLGQTQLAELCPAGALRPLHVAAAFGLADCAEFLLEYGEPRDAQTGNSQTALVLAAGQNHLRCVKLLLRKGCDPSLPDDEGSTALHYASGSGFFDIVQALLQNSPAAPVDVQDRFGDTPLHFSSFNAQTVCAEVLINAGASTNIADDEGRVPLHCAVISDDLSICRMLIKHNARVDHRDRNQQTPLHWAAQNDRAGHAKALLDAGADPSIVDTVGQSAIMLAAFCDHGAVIRAFAPHTARFDLDRRDEDGNTALHWAAYYNKAEACTALLECGANVEVTDNNGARPIHVAACAETPEALAVLVEKGKADLSVGDVEGRSALHWAVSGGHRECAFYLVDHGISINVMDSNWLTPVDWIQDVPEHQESGLLDALLKRGARNGVDQTNFLATRLQRAAKRFVAACRRKKRLREEAEAAEQAARTVLLDAIARGDQLKALNIIAKQQVDLHERDAQGQTALHLATAQGDETLVGVLLESDPTLAQTGDANGVLPLHLASTAGKPQVTKILLASGAVAVDSPAGASGKTALHLAAESNRPDIASLLLEHGAALDIPDAEGATAVQVAADTSSEAVLQTEAQRIALLTALERGDSTASTQLVEGGAVDLRATNHRNGFTALHVAAARGDVAIVRLLLARDPDLAHVVDRGGNTALHLATDPEVIKALVEGGTPADIANSDGKTALHLAAAATADEAQPARIAALVNGGADVALTDADGRTAHALAEAAGAVESVKVLKHAESEAAAAAEAKAAAAAAAVEPLMESVLVEQHHPASADGEGILSPPISRLPSPSPSMSSLSGVAVAKQNLRELQQQQQQQEVGEPVREPLHVAVMSSDVDKIKELLAAGQVDVNEANADGMTALHAAAMFGQTDAIKVLLEGGASLEHADADGCTALHVAAQCGKRDAIKALIELGAAVDHLNDEDQTPLLMAAATGQTEAIEVLLSGGASVAAMDGAGNTALHLAAYSNSQEAVDLLLNWGATASNDLGSTQREALKVDARNYEMASPLVCAAEIDNKRMVRHLIEKGADPGAVRDDGSGALHFAVLHGDEVTTQLLLDKMGDFSNNAIYTGKGNDGWTPLHVAAATGNARIAKLLIDHGANPACLDSEGNLPLHLAASSGNTELVDYLLAAQGQASVEQPLNQAGQAPFHFAAQEGQAEMVKVYLEGGTEVDLRDSDGNTALHIVAGSGSYETVKALAEGGASLDMINTDGETPLHTAAAAGDLEVTEALINAGARINATDQQGNTALHLAMASGHHEVSEMLVMNDARIDQANKEGLTPLDIVAPPKPRRKVGRAKAWLMRNRKDEIKKRKLASKRRRAERERKLIQRKMEGVEALRKELQQEKLEWKRARIDSYRLRRKETRIKRENERVKVARAKDEVALRKRDMGRQERDQKEIERARIAAERQRELEEKQRRIQAIRNERKAIQDKQNALSSVPALPAVNGKKSADLPAINGNSASGASSSTGSKTPRKPGTEPPSYSSPRMRSKSPGTNMSDAKHAQQLNDRLQQLRDRWDQNQGEASQYGRQQAANKERTDGVLKRISKKDKEREPLKVDADLVKSPYAALGTVVADKPKKKKKKKKAASDD